MLRIYAQNFDLNQIAESGQCFRWFKIEDSVPHYHIIAFNKVLDIFQQKNAIYFNCSKEDFDNIWFKYFDLNMRYEEMASALIDSNDNFLSSAYEYGSGIRILNQPLWETIVSFIISQRKSIPAIKTSIERLCRAYGEQIDSTNYYSFPNPEQLIDMSKDDCGLGYRLLYINELAKKVVNNEFNLKKLYCCYHSAKEQLLSVHGIGEKVANCVLLFGLGHLNACPIDVWMQKIIDEEYSGIKPQWMESDFAGVFQQYAFYYKRHIERKR